MQLSSMNEVIWNSSDWGLIKPTTDLNHESNLLVHRSTILLFCTILVKKVLI